ncbi:XK-related protein 4-like [Palaemon carinicauda]|uniref:XK-related protein 4-like n=1 Tax=Palaemon carinicauda TaxID=392227 RepID=UPI0035B5C3B6
MHGLRVNFVEPEGLQILTQPMQQSKFGVFDTLTVLASLGLFYFDVISDILVAYYMYNDKATEHWFLTTVLVLVVPLIIVNGFSLYWYWFDSYVCELGGRCYRTPKASPCQWFFRILGHLLLHASVLRYIDIMYYGIKSNQSTSPAPEEDRVEEVDPKKSTGPSNGVPTSPATCSSGLHYQKLWLHAERDTATVDLLSSLIQDAPQLIVQLYVMSFTIPDQALEGYMSPTLIMQILSVMASFMAMSWSVGSFAKAIRLAEPNMGNLSPAGLISLTLTHYCCIAPQVMCFALFSTKYLLYFIIVVGSHWLLATLITFLTIMCCPNPVQLQAAFIHDIKEGPCRRLDDFFFSSACGLVLLFTFPDIGGRKLQISGILFHLLRLLEECSMIAFWYLKTTGDMWYHWLPLLLVSLFFLLSVAFSSLYFFCFHPDYRKHYNA